MHRALESGRYDFIEGTVENLIINMSVVQIKLVDAYINIETELKPALIENQKCSFHHHHLLMHL